MDTPAQELQSPKSVKSNSPHSSNVLRSLLVFLVGVVLLFFVGVVSFILGTKQAGQQEIPVSIQKPSPTPSHSTLLPTKIPTPVINATLNLVQVISPSYEIAGWSWFSYKSKKYLITFQYPSEFNYIEAGELYSSPKITQRIVGFPKGLYYYVEDGNLDPFKQTVSLEHGRRDENKQVKIGQTQWMETISYPALPPYEPIPANYFPTIKTSIEHHIISLSIDATNEESTLREIKVLEQIAETLSLYIYK